jgi:hypothetical protein
MGSGLARVEGRALHLTDDVRYGKETVGKWVLAVKSFIQGQPKDATQRTLFDEVSCMPEAPRNYCTGSGARKPISSIVALVWRFGGDTDTHWAHLIYWSATPSYPVGTCASPARSEPHTWDPACYVPDSLEKQKGQGHARF